MVPEIWSTTDRIFCHWSIFSFYPTNNPKNQNLSKNENNAWRHYHFTYVYHKWQSDEVWFLRYDVRQNFLSFWAIFCPSTLATTQKIKILRKKKNTWRYYHFTQVHKKLWSLYYTIPEIWHVTDAIFIFHFRLFFALSHP